MSKILKYSFITFAFIIVATVFSSCKKAEYPNLIQGTWQRVIVEENPTHIIELWKFENGKLSITGCPNQGTANYFVKNKVRRSYITITDFHITAFNTDWMIRDLDNDKLIIINDKEGGILTKEFIRYSD